MRLKGTKYDDVELLPSSSLPVSIYARDNNTSVGYTYIKYERFLSGKGKNPGYHIKNFKGSNFIIPLT